MALSHRVTTWRNEYDVVYSNGSHKNHWTVSCEKDSVLHNFSVTAVHNKQSRPCKVDIKRVLDTKDGLEIVYTVFDSDCLQTSEYSLRAVLKKRDGSEVAIQATYTRDTEYDFSLTDDDESDEDVEND